MELLIDPDVKAVLEFMQRNIPAGKLVPVATAVRHLAPVFYGRYKEEDVSALLLIEQPPISDGGPQT